MGLNLKLLQQFSILLEYVVNTRSSRMLLRVTSCNLTTLMMAFSWHDHSMKKSDLQRLGVFLSPWIERELMSTCNTGATMDEDKLRLKPCMHCKSINIVGVSHSTVIRSYPASLDQSKLFMTSASTNYFPRRELHLQFPLSLFTKSLQKLLRLASSIPEIAEYGSKVCWLLHKPGKTHIPKSFNQTSHAHDTHATQHWHPLTCISNFWNENKSILCHAPTELTKLRMESIPLEGCSYIKPLLEVSLSHLHIAPASSGQFMSLLLRNNSSWTPWPLMLNLFSLLLVWLPIVFHRRLLTWQTVGFRSFGSRINERNLGLRIEACLWSQGNACKVWHTRYQVRHQNFNCGSNVPHQN